MSERDETQTPDEPHVVHDGLLQMWVAGANETEGSGFPLTLTVSGAVVTGLLISHGEWLDELDEKFREAGIRAPDEEPLRDLIGPEPLEEGEDRIYRYAHLKDARIISGSSIVPNPQGQGMLWRCRLSHVSGWAWGVMARSRDEDED